MGKCFLSIENTNYFYINDKVSFFLVTHQYLIYYFFYYMVIFGAVLMRYGMKLVIELPLSLNFGMTFFITLQVSWIILNQLGGGTPIFIITLIQFSQIH